MTNVNFSKLPDLIYDVNQFVLTVKFSTDGNYIASGYSGGAIIIWNSKTCVEIHELKGHD